MVAIRDYADEGACVRLIGVEDRHNWATMLESEGANTFTLDVDQTELERFVGLQSCLVSRMLSRISGLFRYIRRPGLPSSPNSYWAEYYWLRIVADCSEENKGPNYLYQTFSTNYPEFFRLVDAAWEPGDPLVRIVGPVSNQEHAVGLPGTSVTLCSAFHVGQGMCALVKGDGGGVLLDAGAGKPISRSRYLSGQLRNDLTTATAGLSLKMVLSHAHRDHWNLLAWDTSLLGRVDDIFIPDKTNALVFKDVAIRHKLRPIGASLRLTMNTDSRLDVFRTAPAPSTPNSANSHALVALFVRGEREKVLFGGDYSYQYMRSDTSSGINSIINQDPYDAVVVPHHGDDDSKKELPSPQSGALAFFSAGTHPHYRHPRQSSIDAHVAIGYTVINGHSVADIIERKLLP